MDLRANLRDRSRLSKDVSTTQNRAFGYVPALDGVRALSLVGILLFHSNFPWARGGFLGVTVFFTLSGFLITSLLLSERERTGSISLRAFWVRRARRLAPAVLVLFAIVAAMLANDVLTPKASIAGDAIATAGWSANWRFVLSGQSYGDMFSQPTPFQHMWSLAVEEQFYLLFPGLLLLLLGRSERLHRWRAALVVLGCVGLSTWLCAFLSHPGAVERSYYGTDTRMAEPFVGVLLALLLTRAGGIRPLHRYARIALDVAAVGALVGLALLVRGYGQYAHSLYTGGLLLVAVLSAVLLAGVTQPGSLVGKVLGLQPLAFIGKISYGGYVFHWPIYLWLSEQRTGLSGWSLFALRCSVTLLVAVVSYALVEEPVRLAKKLHVSIALPAWAATTTLALAALVLASGAVTAAPGAASASGSPSTHAPAAPTPSKTQGQASPTARARPAPGATASRPGSPSAAASRSASASAQPATAQPSSAALRPPPSATETRKPIRVAMVGDSLAQNLGDGLLTWAKTVSNVAVDNLSLSGCPIALGGIRRWPDGYEFPWNTACEWWSDPSSDRMKRLNALDPQVVVVQDGMNELVERKLDSWATYRRAGDPTFDTWLLDQYRSAMQALNPTGTRKVIFLNAVCADWNRVPHFQGFAPELNSRVTALNVDYDQLHSQTGVVVDDLKGHLCPGGRYSDTVDGVSDGRPDGYHLSKPAAVAVAKNWLGPICIDAAKQ
jgi:peptidoglycan/LPS O-acetylase OafA/YrhL